MVDFSRAPSKGFPLFTSRVEGKVTQMDFLKSYTNRQKRKGSDIKPFLNTFKIL